MRVVNCTQFISMEGATYCQDVAAGSYALSPRPWRSMDRTQFFMPESGPLRTLDL